MRWWVALFLTVVTLDAAAQGYPSSRNRGGSPRERPSQGTTPTVVPNDPFSALERELPSLEVDLTLKPDQLDAWRVFARDVRDIAEMDRTRRKHLMSLREGGEAPPTAGALISTLAEEERMRFEGVTDLKRHFDQLYGSLDEGQRHVIDRRVIQSQVEPLGR
jgi:hypothetical protein